VVTPRNPVASSPDDDPTGVRALLSALPEPEPMPAYLVERISASLAAEQAQRAAGFSGGSVTPLLATTRRRPGRILFAVASAAAAVVLVGAIGSGLFRSSQMTTASDSGAAAITSQPRAAEGGSPQSTNGSPNADSKAGPGAPSTPPAVQIRLSDTRYTQAGFAKQAGTLNTTFARLPASERDQSFAAEGKVGTAAGLTGCLTAIGAGDAQMVRADLAFYEGRAAAIIVATKGGIQMAYAVARDCSKANAALLHAATQLP